MNNVIYIVAEKKYQAELWAQQGSLSPNEYVYVGSPSTFRGVSKPFVAYVGAYYDRKDWPEILNMIGVCNGRTPV